jgi:hypothetical protein
MRASAVTCWLYTAVPTAAHVPALEAAIPALRESERLRALWILSTAPLRVATRVPAGDALERIQRCGDLAPRQRAAILDAASHPEIVDDVAFAALRFAGDGDARVAAIRHAAIYADLFRFLLEADVVADLDAAARDPAPRIAAFAALSLIALGRDRRTARSRRWPPPTRSGRSC